MQAAAESKTIEEAVSVGVTTATPATALVATLEEKGSCSHCGRSDPKPKRIYKRAPRLPRDPNSTRLGKLAEQYKVDALQSLPSAARYRAICELRKHNLIPKREYSDNPATVRSRYYRNRVVQKVRDLEAKLAATSAASGDSPPPVKTPAS